jgi:hypothetical protein
VADYLDELVDRAVTILGPELVGAYVAGSLALGAYQPGRSDIDVALIVQDSLPLATKQQLIDRLRHESLPCPARGLELVVYRASAARSGTAEPGFELELNSGPGMPFRQTLRPADRQVADGLFWYGLDRSILNVAGLALLGPPAGQMFTPPRDADVRLLLAHAVRWWLDLPLRPGPTKASADPVLAACRALVWLRHRLWLSKREAAERLLADDVGPAPVIAAALAAGADGDCPSLDVARVFQQDVLAELEGR